MRVQRANRERSLRSLSSLFYRARSVRRTSRRVFRLRGGGAVQIQILRDPLHRRIGFVVRPAVNLYRLRTLFSGSRVSTSPFSATVFPLGGKMSIDALPVISRAVISSMPQSVGWRARELLHRVPMFQVATKATKQKPDGVAIVDGV